MSASSIEVPIHLFTVRARDNFHVEIVIVSDFFEGG
jgi:stress-induced morphogen